MEPQPLPDRARSHTVEVTIGIVAICIFLGVGAWFLFGTRLNLSGTPTTQISPQAAMQNSADTYELLLRQNLDFSSGIQARSTGNFKVAQTFLEKALGETTDHIQHGVVAYWLADTYVLTASYQQAIPLLKTIAQNTAYAPITRAYALQEMALTYYRLRDPGVTTEIFKDQPYIQLQVSGNTGLTYRHLFEYATALYPLALSDLNIATWYVSDAISVTQKKDAGSLTAAEADALIATDLAQVHSDVALADAHISDVEAGTLHDSSYKQALLQRALVLGRMSILGDTSLGDPDAAFTDLLASYQKSGATDDGTVRLQYALFLGTKYGSARASDIQSVLAPLIQEPDSRLGWLKSSLQQIRVTKDANLKASYVTIASIDPDFKKLLISYGWTSSDFAK